MSEAATLLTRPGVEAIFVPARPARRGHLAVWQPGRTPEAFTDTLDLVVPEGTTVRQRTVPVTRLDLRLAIDPLVSLPHDAPCGRSVHAWAAITRGALHLIARGRLLPALDEEGFDAWRIGPYDPEDLAARDALAATLPPHGHATALAATAPRRVSSAPWLVARYWDAVADAYVRTAAAPIVAGHDAFAAQHPVPVAAQVAAADVPSWLATTSSPARSDLTVALRLDDGLGDEGFQAVLEVGSVADPSLVLDAAELWEAPAGIAERFGAAPDEAVLLALRRGARVWPPLGRLLDQARPTGLDLDGAELDELLGAASTQLSGCGIEVRWPAGMLQAVELAPVVASETVAADRGASLDLQAMCDLRWEAMVGGEPLSDAELEALVHAKRTVVRLRGRWVRADPAKLRRLDQRRSLTAGAALAVALSGELVVDGEEVAATVEGPLAHLGDRLATVTDRSAWSPPAGLAATLRPYQRDGAAWLEEMADLGLGGVLADDMGLGKTVQFLALHLARHERGGPTGPTLVVCPVSVLSNWAREAARFAPGVPVVRYHGASRSLDGLPADAVVLTTYGVARREATALAEVGWGLVAADEAQAIKNPLSRTAKALRAVPASARFALTGTPVENRLVDLWALLDWTTPGLLGPLERFRRDVAVPVERDGDEAVAAGLARLVRPFVLRRRKSDPDIAPDLPPKTETDHVVPLTTEQATLYRATVAEILDQIADAEGMSRRGLVLKLLTALKQICNHPAQFLHQHQPLAGRSGKLDAVAELVETITAEGDAVLVFTQFVSMGHLLAEHLRTTERATQFLHGGTPAATREQLVDRFQAGEVPVFVISLKAGGTGLNLTRATHVIHFDRWWNPAVEDQASDRAWRIGQDRPVQIHKMVCEGTVEDRIGTVLADKRRLASSVVTSGEGWVSELDDDDLAMLVSLGASEVEP